MTVPSTRSCRLPVRYSARVIDTCSGAGGGVTVTVTVSVSDAPSASLTVRVTTSVPGAAGAV